MKSLSKILKTTQKVIADLTTLHEQNLISVGMIETEVNTMLAKRSELQAEADRALKIKENFAKLIGEEV